MEDDQEPSHEVIYLQNFIEERDVNELFNCVLSQNTPKKVILEVIDLIKSVIESKQFIKSSSEIIENLKQVMINTFINGKDHDIRVKTVQIIKMFLSELKGYFRKF
mmetsp:Transcript_27916/g.32019  ORF Transcript_27916/g.32019 Transcript_27916/m.32019 type:complete len:106 (-) Transcript_27916:114-431(-)